MFLMDNVAFGRLSDLIEYHIYAYAAVICSVFHKMRERLKFLLQIHL